MKYQPINRTGISYKTIVGAVIMTLFMLVLWLPQIDNCLNIAAPLTRAQVSALSQLPSIAPNRDSLKQFQRVFIRLFIDHFALRSQLIRWNSLMKIRLFRVDQFPKVLIGRQDWLYLKKDDNNFNVFEYYRVLRPFTDESMASWIKPVQAFRDELSRRGIRHILVFAPMKTTVYPEFIPPYLAPVRPVNRREQMIDYVRSKTDIDLVDACVPVREARESHQVFFKHDVHWNSIGAFYGYRAVVTELARSYPAMKPRSIDDFTVQSAPIVGGDLARMLGIEDMFADTNYALVPRFPVQARVSAAPPIDRVSRFTQIFSVSGSRQPKAVVFHDSFFNYMKPFMAEHFSTLACYQAYNRLDYSIIDRDKPDIVIQEMAECYLLSDPEYFTIVK